MKLEGQLQKSKGAGQAYELLVDQLAVLGSCDSVSIRFTECIVKQELTFVGLAILVISYPEETPTSRCPPRSCASALPNQPNSEHITASGYDDARVA